MNKDDKDILRQMRSVYARSVVVRLPRPMEGNGVTPISDPYRTASSTTGGWSRWNILMCFIYIYIILSTTVSHFWTLRMPFFLQGLPFLYTFPFLQVHCALHYCTPLYCSYLWTEYKKTSFSKIRVAFINAYRRVFGLSNRSSASAVYANDNIM